MSLKKSFMLIASVATLSLSALAAGPTLKTSGEIDGVQASTLSTLEGVQAGIMQATSAQNAALMAATFLSQQENSGVVKALDKSTGVVGLFAKAIYGNFDGLQGDALENFKKFVSLSMEKLGSSKPSEEALQKAIKAAYVDVMGEVLGGKEAAAAKLAQDNNFDRCLNG